MQNITLTFCLYRDKKFSVRHYLGSSTGLSLTAAWIAESNQSFAKFGFSVSTAGDVNGDGFSDVIVGAYEYDNNETDEGMAFVYLGSPSGLSMTADWTAESDQDYADFGYSVSTAGDVNGDGFSDVIVGACVYDNGQENEGSAFVYLGSSAGLSMTAAWTAESDQYGAVFGRSVSTAGDVNGDGFSDVIIGAPYYDNGQPSEGRVFVYLGSPVGLSMTADWTAESDQDYANLGLSVSTAGDVNGDGYSDVIVGAPRYENGHSDEGIVFMYMGASTGLSTTAAWIAESDQDGANFGCSVGTAGDVNGDGFADVIVGADGYDNGQTDEGRAFVYLGSSEGLSMTTAWTAESDQDGANFGCSVGTAGDVNGDGYSDIIVGACLYDNGQTDEGRVFVYLGSPEGLGMTAAWTAESDQTGAYFGCSAGTAGDVNGDGVSDVIVGAPYYDNGQTSEGMAFVYMGSSSGLSIAAAWTAEGDNILAQFGISAGTAGDVNGDGFSDIVVGADQYSNGQTYEGKVFVYLGSPTGLSVTADWVAESDQYRGYFGNSVGTAGDVNGDGFSDIVVGAYYYYNGQADEGMAFVYLGASSGLSMTAAWTAEGDQISAMFGYSVSTAGDVNGDGYSDVIVGAYGYDNGQANEGRAFVYLGSSAGLCMTADWTAEGDKDLAQFGISAGTAGDVNGDGYSDIIVGASGYKNGQTDEGRSFIYYGNNCVNGKSIHPTQFKTDKTDPIPLYGFSDSETSFSVSATPDAGLLMGQRKIKLECEVKPAGSLLDGTGTMISADWHDTQIQGYSITEQINDLTGHTAYHWRARLLFSMPDYNGLVASRWYTPYPGMGASLHTNNNPAKGGYNQDNNTIPAAQISQSTDGTGILTLNFRLKDRGRNLCRLHSFQYSTDGGTTWKSPGDASESLGSNWPDKNGQYFTSVPDWTGDIHSFTFNTLHPDVSADFANTHQNDIRIRFIVNDGLDDSPAVTTENFRADNLPPDTGTVVFTDNSGYTNDSTPPITLSSADLSGVSQMRLSLSENGLTSTAWQDYASLVENVDISSGGDGLKSVWAEFKDAFGNIQTVHSSDSTMYDTLPPGIGVLIIQDTIWYTKDPRPDLYISSNGAAYMRLAATESGLASAGWIPYVSGYNNFDISAGGNGQKFIWIQFKDMAGNIQTVPSSDSTYYDATPPSSGSISISDTDGYTSLSMPTLYLSSADAYFMRFALSEPGLSSASWVFFSPVYNSFSISAGGEGSKRIWVEYMDYYNNIQSVHVYDTTFYDITVPVSEIHSPEYENANSVTAQWTTSDGNGSGIKSLEYYYKRGADAAWNGPNPLTVNPLVFSNYTGDGEYYFTLIATDKAGNRESGPPSDMSDPKVSRTVWDRTLPVSRATAIEDIIQPGESVTVNYSCQDNLSGVIRVHLYVQEPSGTVFQVDSQTGSQMTGGRFIYSPPSGKPGVYYFYTLAEDAAGNTEAAPAEADDRTLFSSDFAGYGLIITGSVSDEEGLESHTKTGGRVFQHLKNRNFLVSDTEENHWDNPLDHVKFFSPYNDAPIAGQDDYSVNPDGGLPLSYKEAVEYALTVWAPARMNEIQGPLWIVMLDHGAEDMFFLNGFAQITPQQMNLWLETLESQLPADYFSKPENFIAVILGACYSGSFIDSLAASGRIIISSAAADEVSYRGPRVPGLYRDGEFFVSALFNELGKGSDLYTSYTRAVELTENHTDSGLSDKKFPYFDTARQHPYLDDDGYPGTGTYPGSHTLRSGADGDFCRLTALGYGEETVPLEIISAGKEKTVLEPDEHSNLLWAKTNSDGDPKAIRVWVEIRKPDVILAETGTGEDTSRIVDMISGTLEWNSVTGRYETTYTGFDLPGRYTLFFYAMGTDELISHPKRTYVYKSLENSPPGAFSLLSPADGEKVPLTFLADWTDAADPDGNSVTYTVTVSRNADFSAPVTEKNGLMYSHAILSGTGGITDKNTYYWKVTVTDGNGGTAESAVRSFTADSTVNPTDIIAEGSVFDAVSGLPIPGAGILYGTAVLKSDANGGYAKVLPWQVNYTVTVSAAGYGTESFTVANISEGDPVHENFGLYSLSNPGPGNIDGENGVTLADAVLVLKILAGTDTGNAVILTEADAEGDKVIGLAEAVFILQKVAELRE